MSLYNIRTNYEFGCPCTIYVQIINLDLHPHLGASGVILSPSSGCESCGTTSTTSENTSQGVRAQARRGPQTSRGKHAQCKYEEGKDEATEGPLLEGERVRGQRLSSTCNFYAETESDLIFRRVATKSNRQTCHSYFVCSIYEEFTPLRSKP